VRRIAPQLEGPEEATPKARALALLPAALTAVAFAVLFAQPIYLLVRDWWTLPEAGHGLLLAPVAIWLAWKSGIRPDAKGDVALGVTMLVLAVLIRFAAGLAASLAYGLVRLGFDAEAPIGSTGVVQNKIRILSQQDLIIAISFGRGLRETIEAVKRGRQQNVPTIGITDGDTTPIAQYCDAYLVASTAHTSFIDSYVAPVAALNALLVACAHSQSSRSLKILGESEAANTSSTRWYREARPESEPRCQPRIPAMILTRRLRHLRRFAGRRRLRHCDLIRT